MAKSSKAKAQTKASKVRAKTFATKQQSPHVLVQAQPHPPSTVPTPHVLPPAHPPPVFLTKREVLAKVRLSFATIWKLMQSGEFPRGRVLRTGKLRSRTIWLESEIYEWMMSREFRTYKGDTQCAGEVA